MGFLNQTVISTLVIVLLVCSIGGQIMIGALYQNMIRSSDSMIAADNKLLKQCKQRFVQSYRTNGGVNNIPVFVDKFMNKITICKMTIRGMSHLSGQLMLLSVFVAGVGVCKGIIEGAQLRNLMPYYIISFFGLYVFFCVTAAVDMQGRRHMLKTNLVDYLENHVAQRLQSGIETKRILTEDEETDVKAEEPQTVQARVRRKFSREDAEELEELLRAFLT